MTISTRIAAGGSRSLTRIPMPTARMDECLNAEGKVDPVKAQLAFSEGVSEDWKPFTMSSNDDELVYAACLMFMDRLHAAYSQVKDDPNADVHGEAVTHTDEVVQRKMDRGKFVFVRIKANRVRDGVSVRIEIGNPYGVLGEAEVEARSYAKACAQTWLLIEEAFSWVKVSADADILDEARDSIRRGRLRHLRETCERRTASGYCSPAKFDCPCYACGKCKEVEK